jgi:hypothetical protein
MGMPASSKALICQLIKKKKFWFWLLMCDNPLLFRLGTREKARESVQEGAVETILIATDRLFASTGDAAEMVHQARVLGQATAQLIQAIKVMALMERETGVDGLGFELQ